MSQRDTEQGTLDSPVRSDSVEINSDQPGRTGVFLGVQAKSKYDHTKRYIDSQTHGVHLYCQELTPSTISAQVLIVHGFGEHSKNYLHIAEAFALVNYKVLLYDQRGFGYSGGLRANSTVEQMHMDLETVLLQLDRQLPIFIYCHALGAGLVFSFFLVNPSLRIQGIISSSALLRVPAKYGPVKIMVLRLLNQLCPNLQVNTYLNLSFASKNNFQMKRIATDMLMWPYMSVQFAYNILLFQQFILPNAHKFTTPVLLLHGKENKVASQNDSIDFYRLCQSKEKTLKIFDNGFHEMHNDVEWNKMKSIMLQWTNKILNQDHKISFMRELNHGVSIKPRNFNYLRVLILMILFNKKLRCIKMLAKLSAYGMCEILFRLFN